MCPIDEEADFMRVVVPPQSVDRDDDNWLYHRTVPKGILYYTIGLLLKNLDQVTRMDVYSDSE